ncbi:MAG: hypothetical protein V1831_04190 [Candidatus Woesearchaeota archaeon]
MNLEKAISDVEGAALVTQSILRYWYHYFLKSKRGHPTQIPNMDFHAVYTSLDHEIPFDQNVSSYLKINFKFLPTAIGLRYVTSKETFGNIMDAYANLAKEASTSFREVPTIMPHFTEHSGNLLHFYQAFLKPINCCPSLHTAAPFFAYNACAHYFPEKREELSRYVGEVVSTVIQTKLHALIDIPFGIFLSKKTIEDKLNMDFDDLEDFFTQEQKSKDGVPYEHVYKMYHEINDLAKTIPEAKNGKTNLPNIVKTYFQKFSLPTIKRGESNCFYDLENKRLDYSSPELKVGKGLF